MKRLLSFALLGALISSFLGTPALAGTTGTMRVVVTDANTHAPIAGVQVSAVSPSQSASGVTDAGGGTTFISLAPDSYTVSVLKNGYDPQSQAGISIFADQGQNIAFALHPKLKEIGSVRSVASSSLVRAGTTSDVYSINPSQQRAAKALGGSGSLDQAYSAIASVPGVQIPSGQQGWYQSVFVRGGDYDQVAYEFDGIPVLRESDGAPIVTLSALGQQEVQVYTGGTPATSNSPGLAGYINQVVKTGIYPGYGSFDLAGGAPAFYHKASAEAGGATPNRMISYYVGFAGANQDYRYGSQFNAVSDPLYYYPLWIPGSNANSAGVNLLDGSCGDPTLTTPCPGPNYGAVFSPGNSWTQMNNNDRETVANVHVGIPHRHDTGRDDIQLLYVTGNIFTTYNSSANFLMGSNPTFIGTMNGLTPFTNPFNWLDASVAAGGGIYNGPLNAPPNPNLLVNGPFPSSPTLRALNSPINPNQNDGGSNGYSIEKAQWQRNFNDHSYLRLIGYGEYTNWFLNGPNSSTPTYGATLSDYEVEGWIYGGTVSYSNALSSKNLLTASASYMTQRLQTYNATFTQGSNSGQFGSVIANLTDGQGHCFNFTTGAPWTCYDATQWGTPAAGLTPALGYTCPNATIAACNANAQWLMTENGQSAQVDNVTPYFSSIALQDVIRPNDRLQINAGLRVDNFQYRLDNLTAGYPARPFWFSAYNNENCEAPGQADVSQWNPVTGTFVGCPTGFTLRSTPGCNCAFTNVTGATTSNTVFQPRLAFTWQEGKDTVWRGSYGKYVRPAATSYHEYNTFEQDLPSFLAQFSAFGYTTPYHSVQPDTSNNFDISYERRFPGTKLSLKASPFYRTTQNQLQYLAISALGGVLAGINAGTLTAYGLELSTRYGDFDQDGWSGQLSYTYTNTHIKYGAFPNGQNEIDLLNASIEQYNSYTSFCANPANANSVTCGSGTFAGNAAPTLCNTLVSSGCGAGQTGTLIPNPYYNNAPQGLLDRNASYVPYDVLPGPFSSVNSYAVPDVLSLIVNYKHKNLTITPTFSYQDGSYYGSPLTWPGYVPQGCTQLPSLTPDRPGASCGAGGLIYLPDPYTGGFDNMGSLREPSQFTANLQISYDVSPRSSLTLILTNLYNKCYERGYAWDTNTACIYSSLPSNILPPVGNFLQTNSAGVPVTGPVQLRYPYGLWFNNTQVGITSALQPFEAVLEFQTKI